jgi:adenylosuccinate synthase
MPSIVIVGAQWGDEGKGKLVDYLTESAEFVVRFNGGNNAGHTLVINGKKTKLNLVPSGILRPQTICCIGAGVVLDPTVFLGELDQLIAAGIDVSPRRLRIDHNVQLVMPYHVARDKAREAAAGAAKIGTTGRGIGPAYEDRAARTGIRFAELRDLKSLRPRIERSVRDANQVLTGCGVTEPLSAEDVYSKLAALAERLVPFEDDLPTRIDEAYRAGKRIVFEGAQATFLDVAYGTVPYVTSSTTIAAGAATGVGIGPRLIDDVVAVTKAYTTRVGAGPFPTELSDAVGEGIRQRGGEFGTVTGRPRRCGWLDLVMVKRALLLNGAGSLAVTKLDVLSGIPRIPVATGYLVGGRELPGIPPLLEELAQVTVQYQELAGWEGDLTGIREYSALPLGARLYLEFIEDMVKTPISMVSVGAERGATILRSRTKVMDQFLGR